MNSVPNDLINEIFSRLPSKSIGRFRCVSKLWSSMFQRPYFTELFLTRSSARPRLLLAVQRRHPSTEWSFFSLPQPHNPYENSSSLVVAAEFHMTFPCSFGFGLCGYAFGLIFSEKEQDIVICNPNTGQYSVLPKLRTNTSSRIFLGFDPIDKQFKVLMFMRGPYRYDGDCRILTLGTGEVSWRKIQCPLTHFTLSKGICINGALYFSAEMHSENKILCFNVRFAYLPDTRRRTLELRMWVLDDVEKPEWLKHGYTLLDDKIVDQPYISVAGVTSTGDIVLSRSFYKSFYVFYFNPDRKALQSVEIQGIDEHFGSAKFFVDHGENLTLNDAKLLKSSIYVPSVK
ncbi:unnamed protein product [Microthlaspi erraticum]|uniref:F-box domain-containing protein n=1 Tax=Microthlaspi erraticum TaxID=1685480 RepID=A0A6D2L642_9BRAS|nr:unnamed protein product [Microthlaspi erraticum]